MRQSLRGPTLSRGPSAVRRAASAGALPSDRLPAVQVCSHAPRQTQPTSPAQAEAHAGMHAGASASARASARASSSPEPDPTLAAAAEKASSEEAAVDEHFSSRQVAVWLTERCEINASDAELYADAFAQLGIDKPEDLQMVDGDEVPWPSVIKPVHRKKIQAALP